MAKVPDQSWNKGKCICLYCPSYPGEGDFFCARGKSLSKKVEEGCKCTECENYKEFDPGEWTYFCYTGKRKLTQAVKIEAKGTVAMHLSPWRYISQNYATFIREAFWAVIATKLDAGRSSFLLTSNSFHQNFTDNLFRQYEYFQLFLLFWEDVENIGMQAKEHPTVYNHKNRADLFDFI